MSSSHFADLEMRATYGVARESQTGPRYSWNCERRGREPFVILQYTLAGCGRFDFGGEVLRVPPEHAFVAIAPERVRYFYAAEEHAPWTFAWLNFTGPFAVTLWRRLREAAGPVFRLPREGRAARALRKLAARLEARGPRDAVRDSGEAYGLAMECWAETARRENPGEGVVGRALREAGERFGPACSAKELAASVGLSREHFSRLFAAEMGVSPGRYLAGQRIEAARALLAGTDMTLREIALRAGFGSVRQLIRACWRGFGGPPGSLRKGASIQPAIRITRRSLSG